MSGTPPCHPAGTRSRWSALGRRLGVTAPHLSRYMACVTSSRRRLYSWIRPPRRSKRTCPVTPAQSGVPMLSKCQLGNHQRLSGTDWNSSATRGWPAPMRPQSPYQAPRGGQRVPNTRLCFESSDLRPDETRQSRDCGAGRRESGCNNRPGCLPEAHMGDRMFRAARPRSHHGHRTGVRRDRLGGVLPEYMCQAG